jgi:hypothetical protein
MKKSELRRIIKKLIVEISSNFRSYKADEGEPDTGWLLGGVKRKLGKKYGKPEPWFDQGGYTQLDFPEADYIFGKNVEPEFFVVKTSPNKTIKSTEKSLEGDKNINSIGKIVFENKLKQLIEEMIRDEIKILESANKKEQ